MKITNTNYHINTATYFGTKQTKKANRICLYPNKEDLFIRREQLQKTETFTKETLNEIVETWLDEECLDEGDKIIVMPKSLIDELGKYDIDYNLRRKGIKMSHRGFAVTILKYDGNIDKSKTLFFDPKYNTILKMVNALQNGQTYYCEIGVLLI